MPSLTVGVDEFTLILQSPDKVKVTDWPDTVDMMLSVFLEQSQLENLFGRMDNATKMQAGYTSGLTYTDRPWYLAISWNEDIPTMGICVRFSAYAYAAYQEAFKEQYQVDMDIAVFLQMIQSDDVYTTRLSRIDLTADYYDYSDELLPDRQLSPDLIYERLKNGAYVVRNRNDRQSVRNMSALDREGRYETVYIGSRKGKTNGFLRVYDKKQEQIQTMDYRYDEALQHESWVRFEASFLHDAAHQLTEQLLSEGMTAQDLQRWIARHITDKYRFVHSETGEATEFTADLLGVAAGSSVAALSTPSPRDNSLRQSIRYLRDGSGLYSTLFKVANIWGPEAARELMDFLLCEYEQYQDALLDGEYPYKLRELTAWLQRHAAETAKHPLTSYL